MLLNESKGVIDYPMTPFDPFEPLYLCSGVLKFPKTHIMESNKPKGVKGYCMRPFNPFEPLYVC